MMAGILTGLVGNDAHGAPMALERGKAVVVFFSWSPDGNTRFAAETIARRLSAEFFEIRAAKPYSSDFRTCTQEAGAECQAKTLRPIQPLKGLDLGKHEVVFVGTPNWWGTMAPPVRTWVAQNREGLRGKAVCVFQTHGGGGMQRVGRDFAELLPESTVLPPAAFLGASVRSGVRELERFVEERIAGRGID